MMSPSSHSAVMRAPAGPEQAVPTEVHGTLPTSFQADNPASGLREGSLEERPTVFIVHPSDLLTDHLPNGDGLVAFGFIDRLAARGYRLHIAVRQTALRAPLPANVTLYPIGSGRDGLASRARYMIAMRRLLRRLRKCEPIGIVHQMNPVFAGLSLGLLGCGLPLVLGTFVARWPDEAPPRGASARLRRAATGAARWVVTLAQQSQASALLMTTPAAANRIAAPSWSRRRMFTVRHGIDTALFRPDPDWAAQLRAMPPSILFYSHVDRRKGIFVLIEAFRIVAQAIPACRMTVVGRGDHAREAAQAIAASGLGDRIGMAEPVDRTQAPGLFRTHSVYCLPSFGEPYATTVLEAMACARPVVVTDAGGLTHMVPDRGAVRVPVGDPQALAAGLIEVLRSPERQVAMGAANLDFIREYCAWDKVVDSLEAVYARLLRPAAPNRPSPST